MPLPLILGQDRKKDADYLDTCRSKRNIVEYEYVGGVTEQDATELIEFVIELKEDVLNWVKKHHPNLGKDLSGPLYQLIVMPSPLNLRFI